MGLPEINIEFKGKAVSVIQRSELGIVALVFRDAIDAVSVKEYKNIEEVQSSDWSPKNVDYLKKSFLGLPSKVIAIRLATDEEISNAYSILNSKKWNYLAIPEITTSEVSDVATWIKSKRTNEKKTLKAVLPNHSGDHEGIINFSTDEIKVGEQTYSTAEYCARIAGVLAGLPFTRSATYFVLDEVDSIKESEDPNADIDAGKLILVNDGEKIKIGRGVNSLVTTTSEKTEDFKKIKIVEIMDMVMDDIRDVFNNNYVGKVPNTYDNQVLFFTSVNAYFKDLSGDEILDPNFENEAFVDVEAQRLAWEKVGTNTSAWDEQRVKEMSFKSNVFAAGSIKIVDAMEDLDFQIHI